MEEIIKKLPQYAMDFGSKIIIAALVFFIGRIIAKWLTSVAKNIMAKSHLDNTLARFVESITYIALMTVVFISTIGTLGVQTTSFIAILGSAGLAIGLALQGSLSNFASGALIILFKLIKVGHYVEAGGASGTVEEISVFNTILNTPDNKVIIIPNSKILSNNIINYSVKETRRVDLTFGIGYGDDLKLAKETLLEIANADERVLKEPKPFVAVSQLADSSVNFIVKIWVKSADYWAVNHDTIEKVKLTFDEKGISIPYPQQDVHYHSVDKKVEAE